MLALMLLCAVVAAAACMLLVRLGQESARQYRLDMPQRFHAGHVPRLGGAAMLASCLAGWLWMAFAERLLGVQHSIPFDGTAAATWALVVTLGVAPGLVEDITHRLRARLRMIGSALAAALAVFVFGLAVPRLGFPAVDALWQSVPVLGMALALLAICGLPHAFNLIDGYNGLAGTVALIVCMAMAYVGLQLGDRQLAALVLVLAGATVGFLIWNYPHGVIFAGDGGAYLWGVVISIVSILLVQRHPDVSPWFPVLLLIYPIWETVFSITRKMARGQSPSVADALHFHQLIYRRVVRQVFHDDTSRRMLMRNNRTSPYLWGFTVLTVVPAVLFWKSTPVLLAFIALFIVSYLWAYYSIVQFRMQRWLRWHRRGQRGPGR